MTDDRSERLSQLQLKITQFERERQHVIREQREDLCSLKETLWLSLLVVMWSSIPSVLWVVGWATIVTATEPVANQILTAGFSLGLLAVISAGAARGSGLTAYWWFNRTNVSRRMATIVISLLATAIVFGWVIAVTRWAL